MNAVILWAGIGWLVLFAVTFTAVILARPPRRADRVATLVGLPLPDDLRELASGLQRRDYVGSAASSAIGVILGGALLFVSHANSFAEILGGYLLVIMVALGIGTTISVLGSEKRRQDSSVRVARMRVASLSDYESPLRSWGIRATVGLLVIGLLVRIATTPGPATATPIPLAVYVLASVTTLVVIEFAKHRIIGRGQPAGSEIELAWDDAIKGRAIYALGIAPLFLGSYGGLLVNIFDVGVRAHSAQAAGLGIEAGIGVLGMLVNLVVQLSDAATKPQQRYLRRLWPALSHANASAAAPTAQPIAPVTR
jgi:hypothetical protein